MPKSTQISIHLWILKYYLNLKQKNHSQWVPQLTRRLLLVHLVQPVLSGLIPALTLEQERPFVPAQNSQAMTPKDWVWSYLLKKPSQRPAIATPVSTREVQILIGGLNYQDLASHRPGLDITLAEVRPICLPLKHNTHHLVSHLGIASRDSQYLNTRDVSNSVGDNL